MLAAAARALSRVCRSRTARAAATASTRACCSSPTVAWMDDVTAPSSHVRHNLEGLGDDLPAGLPALVRHRRSVGADPRRRGHAALLPQPDGRRAGAVVARRGVRRGGHGADGVRDRALHGRARRPLPQASLLPLTPQTGAAGSDGWDAIQVMSAASGDSVVHAFASGAAADSTAIRLRGLDPEATYLVPSRAAPWSARQPASS
ncbi:MAG: GH36 C-terminal domain-containing protein [Marinilabiliales bacterium]|nr:GH36 C-terminal domain-containing protein [Marinilabiliales bacterium]